MDALASQDQEFKASRETIMKLVSEVSQQKRAAATCTDEMKVLKKVINAFIFIKVLISTGTAHPLLKSTIMNVHRSLAI